MTPSQRLEPGDPRAKAIEAMARGVRQRWLDEQRLDLEPAWEHLHDESKDSYLADARAALAALEQEGLVLTDTREDPRMVPLAAVLLALEMQACRTQMGRSAAEFIEERFEHLADTHEVQRLREALNRIGELPRESRGGGLTRARSIAREALSSVPTPPAARKEDRCECEGDNGEFVWRGDPDWFSCMACDGRTRPRGSSVPAEEEGSDAEPAETDR